MVLFVFLFAFYFMDYMAESSAENQTMATTTNRPPLTKSTKGPTEPAAWNATTTTPDPLTTLSVSSVHCNDTYCFNSYCSLELESCAMDCGECSDEEKTLSEIVQDFAGVS